MKTLLTMLFICVLALLPGPAAAEDGAAVSLSAPLPAPGPEASCPLAGLFREKEDLASSPVFFASSGDDIAPGCCSLGAETCATACRLCGVLVYQCVRVTNTTCVPACVCRTCGST